MEGYSDTQLQALRTKAWYHILQANQGLGHPTLLHWRLHVLPHLTCMVATYTDGEGATCTHRIVL